MPDVSVGVTGVAYGLCALLIAAHAWQRFNTPATNRSSTRQTLYWSSFAGYLVSALLLFAALSVVLQVAAWGKGLLGSAYNAAVPAPLMATLVLTTLLPSVPLLQRVDAWFLSLFHDWGEIPAEAKRLAADMTNRGLHVTEGDVTRLKDVYGDGSYGETLSENLRAFGADGLARSQFRFTRVVKLYDRIIRLSAEEGYTRFFNAADVEFAELQAKVGEFLRRSATSLTMAARLHAYETEQAYEELMRDRQLAFAQACNEIIAALALFLARAVLRSEPTEAAIESRLQEVGFEIQPTRLPAFPIHSLTALAVGIFLYLACLGIFFAHVTNVPQQPGAWLVMACKIALARVLSLALTIWLIQRYPFFRRAPGESPRYFAYLICGLAGGIVSLLIVAAFHAMDPSVAFGVQADVTPVVLSALLCLALAYCCNDWPGLTDAPGWLRLAEAAGCGGVVVLGSAFLYFNDQALPMHGWLLAAWFLLPAVLGAGIGGFVPCIYRRARCATSVRREPYQPAVVDQEEPVPVLA